MNAYEGALTLEGKVYSICEEQKVLAPRQNHLHRHGQPDPGPGWPELPVLVVIVTPQGSNPV